MNRLSEKRKNRNLLFIYTYTSWIIVQLRPSFFQNWHRTQEMMFCCDDVSCPSDIFSYQPFPFRAFTRGERRESARLNRKSKHHRGCYIPPAIIIWKKGWKQHNLILFWALSALEKKAFVWFCPISVKLQTHRFFDKSPVDPPAQKLPLYGIHSFQLKEWSN